MNSSILVFLLSGGWQCQSMSLIECVDFNAVRQRFYQVPSLQDLFKTVKPEVILEFLKAAALYRLL